MLIVYTPQITERILFTMDVVFKEHLGIDFKLIDSVSEFEQAPLPKIVYASEAIFEEIYFWQHSLMLETDIRTQVIDISDYECEPIFFQSPDNTAFLPFDIFSVVFYLLSRYEEYLPFQKDAFGRFPATQSLAFRTGFLQSPLVDILILKLAERLKQIFPTLRPQKKSFQYMATYDIDNAYLYRHKGFMRTIGGMGKQLLKLNWQNVKERIAVLSGKKPDPNDNYDYMETLWQQFRMPVYYFILFSGTGVHDHGLSPSNKHFRAFIRDLANQGNIGIHPSFASASNKNKLQSEIQGLSAVIDEKISMARSHFLLLEFPTTYRNFIKNGITEDFTLGYADHPGFRASTSRPFYFFDLLEHKKTSLLLHPFAYMDETLRRYLQLDPDAAFEMITGLMAIVKSVGGDFISLWHNENFSPSRRSSWGGLYERSLQYAESCRKSNI